MKPEEVNTGSGHVGHLLPDWLCSRLDQGQEMQVRQHLTDCMECREAYFTARQVWDNLGKMSVPEPGPQMRTQFYAMLDRFREEEAAPKRSFLQDFLEKIKNTALPQWAVQLAFSLLLVGLGWAIGYQTSRRSKDAPDKREQIENLAAQVEDMKSTLMLSLIENPSATERLRAVGYTSEITNADERVINALLTTLNHDPNVNVRLVSLEALTQYVGDPLVREGLVKSLAMQDSPMVQVALADVMVRLQEKGSVKALKSLLRKEGLNQLVKNKIEQTIRDLS